MSINQINAAGASPPPPPSASVSDTNVTRVAPSPVSTVQPAINNLPGSKEPIKQAVQKIQETVDNLAQNLRFSVDEDTGKTIIKVVDAHTEEVIRQFPTEQAIEIA
ncbi:MAG: flagellar protein FlaG, partial [Pseudomonadota bacterium]